VNFNETASPQTHIGDHSTRTQPTRLWPRAQSEAPSHSRRIKGTARRKSRRNALVADWRLPPGTQTCQQHDSTIAPSVSQKVWCVRGRVRQRSVPRPLATSRPPTAPKQPSNRFYQGSDSRNPTHTNRATTALRLRMSRVTRPARRAGEDCSRLYERKPDGARPGRTRLDIS